MDQQMVCIYAALFQKLHYITAETMAGLVIIIPVQNLYDMCEAPGQYSSLDWNRSKIEIKISC